MPTRRALTVSQANDETLNGTVLDDEGAPLDLTGVTLEMLLKPTAETDDADPSVVKLSTGSGITVSAPLTGAYSVAIPDTALTEAGVRWYRVDAVQGTSRKTVVYGPLKVRDI
ncbi:hypothetical protein OHR68_09900 [Spirillospora sp. NBC_00431]